MTVIHNLIYVSFQVLMVVIAQIMVFWGVTPCSLVADTNI
jgi:hypothetical protein